MPGPDNNRDGLYGNARRGISNPQAGKWGQDSEEATAIESMWQLPGGIPVAPSLDLFKGLSAVQFAILDLLSKGYEAGEINHTIGMEPGDTRIERAAMMRALHAKSLAHATYLAGVAGAYRKPLENIPNLENKIIKPNLKKTLWLVANGFDRDETSEYLNLSRGIYELNIAGMQSIMMARTLPHAVRIAYETKTIPNLKDL
jgi:hypothetical protein